MEIPPYEEFLKQMKINLWIMGIPYGENKIQIRFHVLAVILFMMFVAETAFFVSRMSVENFLELTQLAPCMCIGILSLLKIVAVCLKRRKIYELSYNLSLLYEDILADTKKIEIVKYELLLLNILMKYFFVLNVVLINVYNFSTLGFMFVHYLKTKEVVLMLPYDVLLPFSTNSFIPWASVYLYSIMCGFICVLFYTAVDGLYFVLTSHICSNFRIISDKIKNLNTTNATTLTEIVESHQYILKLGEDLEDIFTAPNLFNVLVGSLEICALGFNLANGSWAQLPGCMLFITSVLLQILMMSVFGENIIQESINIGDSAFLCDWYKMDNKSKTTILTIMIRYMPLFFYEHVKEFLRSRRVKRSRKPQRLTAYKFSTICYASFTKIISTSWSYFTILRTVYTPPEVTKIE